jgi:hypothetical protein
MGSRILSSWFFVGAIGLAEAFGVGMGASSVFGVRRAAWIFADLVEGDGD